MNIYFIATTMVNNDVKIRFHYATALLLYILHRNRVYYFCVQLFLWWNKCGFISLIKLRDWNQKEYNINRIEVYFIGFLFLISSLSNRARVRVLMPAKLPQWSTACIFRTPVHRYNNIWNKTINNNGKPIAINYMSHLLTYNA